jgi:2-dehydro-3-deoxygluconokinase
VAGGLGAVGEGLFEIGLDEGDEGPLRRGYGGDVANVCVMAARAGIDARLAARVGDDALGRALLAFWQAEGVDVGHVRTDSDAPTGIYVNKRTPCAAHRFDYHRRGSAGSRLAPEDIAPAFLDGLDVLHASGISLAVAGAATAAAVERARSAGASISFAVNHRPALRGDPEVVLAAARAADVVFVSTEEAKLLLETSDAEEVLEALAGAYLVARIGGLEPRAALARGVAAAALSCRAFGCALSYPPAAEVETLAKTLT